MRDLDIKSELSLGMFPMTLEPDLRQIEMGDEADLTDDEPNTDAECSNISNKKVIVLGAGVAGISTALFLKKHNVETIVLEGRDRIGGRIYTDYNTFGAPVDLGASIITGTDLDPTGKSSCDPCGRICRAFGLGLHFLDSQTLPLYHEQYKAKQIPKAIDTQSAKLFDQILDEIAGMHTKGQVTVDREPQQSLGSLFFRYLTDSVAKMDPSQMLCSLTSPLELDQELPMKSLGHDVTAVVLKQKRFSETQVNVESNEEWEPPPTSKKLKITYRGQDDVVLEILAPSPMPPGPIKAELIHQASEINAPFYNGAYKAMQEWLRNENLDAKVDVVMWHKAHLEYGCGTSLNNVSSVHWNQDEDFGGFNGRHAVVKGGLAPFVERLGIDLDIRLEKEVTKIKYGSHGVEVFTKNGESFEAGVVICTVPLGVLKSDAITFQPALPSWKKKAIENIGFGNLNKVVLEFSAPFWDTNVDYFGLVPHPFPETEGKPHCKSFTVANGWVLRGNAILTGVISGHMANQVEEMSEEEVILLALTNLSKVFTSKVSELYLRGKVTHWKKDRFSRGCYTYVPVGSTGRGYENLGHPVVGHGYGLLFGGEHTNKEHPDTIGGAMISGIREGKRALGLLYGRDGYKRKVETPSFVQRACDRGVSEILFSEAESELARRGYHAF